MFSWRFTIIISINSTNSSNSSSSSIGGSISISSSN